MQKSKLSILNNIKQKLDGFGLIEVTVSIYIISMGLLGLMSLVSQNLKIQNINKNTIIASQLAQEGIELVRNVRDNNWRDENFSWEKDVFTNGSEFSDYIIDYRGRDSIDKDISGIADEKARLRIHNSGTYEGFYTHSTTDTTNTPFFRIIEVDQNDDHTLTVRCVIYWQERDRDHDYLVETKLYNWKFAG